ncbi:hypothetical protein TNCV_2312601 [Trichonephila clavipes]|nr:hypothetical protein TNCV_2312601 [Trichonephila clavipes]
MLDWIQVRRARWPFHTLYCFSFNACSPHRRSSMWSGIVSSGKRKESPWLQRPWASAYAKFPPHTIQPSSSVVTRDLSRTNAGLFRGPVHSSYKNTLGCHTLD